MTIIERLNSLRMERANLLNEANATDSMDRLAEIQARLNSLNEEIATVEAIRDQMGAAAEPVQQHQNAEPAARELSFGEQLQRVAADGFRRKGATLSGVNLRENAATGQNETVQADGGVLLSPTVTRSLLQGVRENSFFLPRVRKIAVGSNSNSVEMPYLEDKDRTDGKRFGGARAYWMNEGDQYDPSKIKFGTRTLKLAKLGALGYATEEILRDSTYLESIMTDAFVNAMVWEVDEAILFGAGTHGDGKAQPTGMLSAENTALVTVAKEASQAAKTVTAANIISMWGSMAPEARNNAIWMVNPDIETQLIQMAMQAGDSDSKLVYMPANGLSASPYGTLFGRPVVPNEHMAAGGSVGDIAFINPGDYIWIDRDGIKQASSVHVRFEYDEMAFKFTYRCNGLPSWYAKSTPAKGGTARSPYVTLAARA